MLRICYFSSPAFADLDFSMMESLQKCAHVHFFMDYYPKLRNATIFNNPHPLREAGIIPMAEFESTKIFSERLDLKNCFIVYRISNNPLHSSNLLLQLKLYMLVKKISPDSIHFNNFLHFNHFYLFLFKSRLMISIHDPFPHSSDEKHAASLLSRFYRFVNDHFIKHHLLYNKTQLADYSNFFSIDPSRVFASRLGPYSCLPSSHFHKMTYDIDFLFFGRIEKYKGLELLLDAFRLLLNSNPQAKLCIAGKGDLGFDLKSKGIPENNICFINRFIPNEELEELIAHSKVIVCPYLDATQSGVVMTAYGFRTPVIVTDVGALAESVDHGLTGMVVEPNNPLALSKAMIFVIEDQFFLSKAPGHIDDIYYQGNKSWRAICSNLIDIYHKICH